MVCSCARYALVSVELRVCDRVFNLVVVTAAQTMRANDATLLCLCFVPSLVARVLTLLALPHAHRLLLEGDGADHLNALDSFSRT